MENKNVQDHVDEQNIDHPGVFSPSILLPVIVLSVGGAIIGMQLIVTLGISANTSIIGALFAILLSRVPLLFFRRYRSLERQNLIQTATSAATFSAANGLMIPIGIPFVMGQPDLVIPLLIGASLALLIDFTMLFGLFNSKPFPASGAWPAGIATAEAIWAGDQGGKKVRFLGIGIAAGAGGACFGIPMSAAGVALIGNISALGMFGIGLLVRGYSKDIIGDDLFALYIPQGMMVGAGLIALVQVMLQIFKRQKNNPEDQTEQLLDRSPSFVRKMLGAGYVMYIVAAFILTVISGLITEMSLPQLLGFLIYAACAAYVSEMIVGIAAMHSGWFPAFAVGLINLVIGLLVGFPPIALGLLVGYCTAIGPAFADLGFDFKTGFLLRGCNKNRRYEQNGRRQQYFAAVVGFFIAAVVVAYFHNYFFAQGKVPPVDLVFVSTIKAGASAEVARELFLWAIPGAIIQLLGGTKRQLGVLFGTGLLINFPIAGWTVLATLVIRIFIERRFTDSKAEISAFAGGLIAGDAILTFVSTSLFGMAPQKLLPSLFGKN